MAGEPLNVPLELQHLLKDDPAVNTLREKLDSQKSVLLNRYSTSQAELRELSQGQYVVVFTSTPFKRPGGALYSL